MLNDKIKKINLKACPSRKIVIKKIRIKHDRKKNGELNNKKIKFINHLKNNNKKNRDQIWDMKKLKKGKIENNFQFETIL